MLTVTVPAADTGLLTIEETRAAVGVTGSAQDADLEILRVRVATAICAECRIHAAGITPLTLRQETLRETFRPQMAIGRLVLARRPVVSVSAVTVDGAAIDPAGFELDTEDGTLRRLVSDMPARWLPMKTVVDYVAGWDVPPPDLKLAAAKMSLLIWHKNGPKPRDPSIKRESVDGIGEVERWVGPQSDPAFPQEVRDLLRRYRNGRRWS